ncbi:TPA: chorismate synthase [Candidatus Scatousia excrementigallinarum]|uniref:Chorismate synthase n=1 Tax=Candidatus Scatousia excrementigallinarum TaxID=2840935 RepID=A0A9D1EY33_9BACT|nr:chorismate synthase [Candidatus Scatousia excrementigallinarum]
MEKFRFLTSGESHGKCLTAIIEGLPANLEIDIDFINEELKRRQCGYGRGGRMKIESDTVEIMSGVRFGKTLGSPVTLVIKNNDFENWQKVMIADPKNITSDKAFTTFRPGHADYAGSVKYNQKDLRNILERSSARKTAIEVAVGAVAKLFLKQFGITGSSKVLQIGNGKTEEEFRAEIDKAKAAGDTLGGKIEVVYENLPVGLGSFVHWDRTLDGKIAQAVMSVPAVKSVSIGNHHAYKMTGSEYHDEIFCEEGKIIRKTNNAGGIEGGMSNGENIVVTAVMKPIPTLRKPLCSLDCVTLEQTEAHFERSDTCAVEACAVVAEARVACVLADEILLKYGGDCMEECLKHFNN